MVRQLVQPPASPELEPASAVGALCPSEPGSGDSQRGCSQGAEHKPSPGGCKASHRVGCSPSRLSWRCFTSTSFLPGITGIATAAHLCLSFPWEGCGRAGKDAALHWCSEPRGGALCPCSDGAGASCSRRVEACVVSLVSPVQRIFQLGVDGPRSNLHQRSNASVSSAGGGSFVLCPQRCQPDEEEEESEFVSELV